ncbi:MAG: hypothetical protein AAF471_03175 [Myxococcota bacterium]
MNKKVRRALAGSLLALGGLGLGKLVGGTLLLGLSSLGGCEDDPNERFFYAKQVTDKFNELAATALYHAAQKDDSTGGDFAQLPLMQQALGSPPFSTGSEDSAAVENLLGFARQVLSGKLQFNLRRPERGDWDFIYDIKLRSPDQSDEPKDTTPESGSSSTTNEGSAPVQRLTQENANVSAATTDHEGQGNEQAGAAGKVRALRELSGEKANPRSGWEEYWDKLGSLGLEARIGFKWEHGNPYEKRWYDDPSVEAVLGLRRKGDNGPFTPVLWARAQAGRFELESLRTDFAEATGPLWAAVLKLPTNSIRINDSSVNFTKEQLLRAMEMRIGDAPKHNLHLTIRFPDKDGHSACVGGDATCIAFEPDNVPPQIVAELEADMARARKKGEQQGKVIVKKQTVVEVDEAAQQALRKQLDSAQKDAADLKQQLGDEQKNLKAEQEKVADRDRQIEQERREAESKENMLKGRAKRQQRAREVQTLLQQAAEAARKAVQRIDWIQHLRALVQDGAIRQNGFQWNDLQNPARTLVQAAYERPNGAYARIRNQIGLRTAEQNKCLGNQRVSARDAHKIKACFQARLAHQAAQANNWQRTEQLLNGAIPHGGGNAPWQDDINRSAGNGGALPYARQAAVGHMEWNPTIIHLENALAAIRTTKAVSNARAALGTVPGNLGGGGGALGLAQTGTWTGANSVASKLQDARNALQTANQRLEGNGSALDYIQSLVDANLGNWPQISVNIGLVSVNVQTARDNAEQFATALQHLATLQDRATAAALLPGVSPQQKADAQTAMNRANQALLAAQGRNWTQAVTHLQNAVSAAQRAVP